MPKLERFAWNANPESNIAGYRILAGRVSGFYSLPANDVGNVLSGTYLQDGDGDWFHALIAYNTAGEPSATSLELGPLKLLSPAGTVRGS
jgi:hypothetical protein